MPGDFSQAQALDGQMVANYAGASVSILDITPVTGLAGAKGRDGSIRGGNDLPAYRFMVSDQSNLYFRVLPVEDMSAQDLTQILQSRKDYKKTLFAGAIKQLEKDPNLPDLPGCTSALNGLSGQCVFNPDAEPDKAGNVNQTSQAEKRDKSTTLSQISRKFAVVIGQNKYTDARIPQLIGAVPDAIAVNQVLHDQLGYDVVLLKDATKREIFSALNAIAAQVKESDSLLVYFAGHGEMVDATGLGYWIPKDALANDPAGWISNADLNRLLTRSKSKQMVVVSDSCYSGLFAQESKVNSANTTGTIDELLQRRAVTVMSSGSDEPVADTGKDSHSVFSWNLVNNLKNVNGWKRGAALFDSVRVAVERELPQTPQYGASLSAGHQAGGDYVFERRAATAAQRP
jgi:uncharacterized caspase-like protein